MRSWRSRRLFARIAGLVAFLGVVVAAVVALAVVNVDPEELEAIAYVAGMYGAWYAGAARNRGCRCSRQPPGQSAGLWF